MSGHVTGETEAGGSADAVEHIDEVLEVPTEAFVVDGETVGVSRTTAVERSPQAHQTGRDSVAPVAESLFGPDGLLTAQNLGRKAHLGEFRLQLRYAGDDLALPTDPLVGRREARTRQFLDDEDDQKAQYRGDRQQQDPVAQPPLRRKRPQPLQQMSQIRNPNTVSRAPLMAAPFRNGASRLSFPQRRRAGSRNCATNSCISRCGMRTAR